MLHFLLLLFLSTLVYQPSMCASFTLVRSVYIGFPYSFRLDEYFGISQGAGLAYVHSVLVFSFFCEIVGLVYGYVYLCRVEKVNERT